MLRSKFVGCMLGCAIGDALGSSLEGLGFIGDISDLRFSGRWTDDTHMMIGVAESLIECRGFNDEHMTWTFIRNWLKEPWRGYGPGPPRVFRLILAGVPRREAARMLFGGEGSFGNGAAMRIAPIALFYHDDLHKLREVASKSAEITHAHKLGIEGAVLQAYAIALALRLSGKLNPEDYLGELASLAESEQFKSKLLMAIKLLKEDNKAVIVKRLGNGVEAFESVPTAIYCFAKNHEDYAKVVLYAISLGGDTDTIAAMAGAIAGAYHGEEALPRKWVENLERRDYIKRLAEKLWELKVKGDIH